MSKIWPIATSWTIANVRVIFGCHGVKNTAPTWTAVPCKCLASIYHFFTLFLAAFSSGIENIKLESRESWMAEGSRKSAEKQRRYGKRRTPVPTPRKKIFKPHSSDSSGEQYFHAASDSSSSIRSADTSSSSGLSVSEIPSGDHVVAEEREAFSDIDDFNMETSRPLIGNRGKEPRRKTLPREEKEQEMVNVLEYLRHKTVPHFEKAHDRRNWTRRVNQRYTIEGKKLYYTNKRVPKAVGRGKARLSNANAQRRR